MQLQAMSCNEVGFESHSIRNRLKEKHQPVLYLERRIRGDSILCLCETVSLLSRALSCECERE